MENLIFVGIIGAIGVILYSTWKLIEAQREARRYRMHDGKPFPPFKRTVSGPDPVEQAKVDFQQRIDNWQRTQMPRWSGLRNSADELTGEKYRFEPRQRQRINGRGGLRNTGGVRQQFELLG
ncbi:MAG: hypothetical protein P8Y52_13795 [Xanthomonadales bacterium]